MSSTGFDLDSEIAVLRASVFLQKGISRASRTRQNAIELVRDLRHRAMQYRKFGVKVPEPVDKAAIFAVFDVIGEATVAGNMAGYSDDVKALMMGLKLQWQPKAGHKHILFQEACSNVGLIAYVRRERELTHGHFFVQPLNEREAEAHHALETMGSQNPQIVAAGREELDRLAALPEGRGTLPDEVFWRSLRSDPQFQATFAKEVAQLSL